MANERAAEPLHAVADMLSGGTPRKSNQSYWNGSVPWLTPKDMGKWSGITEAKVSPDAIGNGTRLAPKEAIFLVVRGMSLHKEIRILRPDEAMTFNQDIKAIVAKKCINPLYLYYVIVSKKRELFNAVEAAGHGTGRLPTDKLKDLLVPRFHPLTEEALAELLGAVDRRIELNRRMNETLKVMARAIFQDWFVEFGPTRAKVEGRAPYLAPELWGLFPDAFDEQDKPIGWSNRSVYEFADVIYGAPFSSKRFNAADEGVPLIRIRDLASHKPGVSTVQVHKKGHMIEAGDIIVGMDGEFRLHLWKGPRAWLNQRVCHFEPKVGVPKAYLAEALKEPLAFFERGKVGTTVIHLGKSDIDTFKLICPGERLLDAFAKVAEPLVEATVSNAQQSRTLARTRDLLLPKLMSGEIRFAEAEKGLEEVA